MINPGETIFCIFCSLCNQDTKIHVLYSYIKKIHFVYLKSMRLEILYSIFLLIILSSFGLKAQKEKTNKQRFIGLQNLELKTDCVTVFGLNSRYYLILINLFTVDLFPETVRTK